ncbi:MAG: hypothetical protein WD845_06370 [Pirellulales bacterium]
MPPGKSRVFPGYNGAMCEDREFESYPQLFEEHITQRPLTPEELAELRGYWNSPQAKAMRLASNPMAWARARVEFMRKFKKRQGTKTPDFNALYHRKAELDEKLGLGDP